MSKKLCPVILLLLSGNLLFSQTDNSIIFADQHSSLTFQQIIDSSSICPLQGCTIYATSPNASTTIGSLDPGTKFVTLYLGPFIYSVDQITLRSGSELSEWEAMARSYKPRQRPQAECLSWVRITILKGTCIFMGLISAQELGARPLSEFLLTVPGYQPVNWNIPVLRTSHLETSPDPRSFCKVQR